MKELGKSRLKPDQLERPMQSLLLEGKGSEHERLQNRCLFSPPLQTDLEPLCQTAFSHFTDIESMAKEERIMLITVPTENSLGLDAQVASHFGRSAYFTTVNLETGEVSVLQNRGHHFGGCINPATAVTETKAEVIACAGLGRKALEHFRGAGIEVYTGAEGTVRDVCESFRNGTLPRASEEAACAGRHGDRTC